MKELMFFFFVIQGHVVPTVDPNIFSRKLVPRGYAKFVNQVGTEANESSITLDGLIS